jgi:cytochrome d ubiquinol oxidase subunit II
MEIVAVAVLAFFAVGYFLLGGADVGTGMVLPFIARTSDERRLVVTAIAPFFLANEVWLVAVAGLLAGAFPPVEYELLHGLFLPFATLLCGWVVRDLGLWLRGRVDSRRWRWSWDLAIVAGSWAVALSWGVILVSILAGSAERPVTGTGAVVGAVAIALLFAAHGAGFAALRLTGTLRHRARRLTRDFSERRLLTVTAACLAAVCIAAGVRLDVAGGTADADSLAFLMPGVLAVMPVLLAAQAWVWLTFRRRVTEPSYL